MNGFMKKSETKLMLYSPFKALLHTIMKNQFILKLILIIFTSVCILIVLNCIALQHVGLNNAIGTVKIVIQCMSYILV